MPSGALVLEAIVDYKNTLPEGQGLVTIGTDCLEISPSRRASPGFMGTLSIPIEVIVFRDLNLIEPSFQAPNVSSTITSHSGIDPCPRTIQSGERLYLGNVLTGRVYQSSGVRRPVLLVVIFGGGPRPM